jgi:hypothetical protein
MHVSGWVASGMVLWDEDKERISIRRVPKGQYMKTLISQTKVSRKCQEVLGCATAGCCYYSVLVYMF